MTDQSTYTYQGSSSPHFLCHFLLFETSKAVCFILHKTCRVLLKDKIQREHAGKRLFVNHYSMLLVHVKPVSWLTMLGYCYLTRGLDNSILYPCYPTLPNYFFMTTSTTTAQLNKLPLTTIILRIINGTIRFNNDKIQTQALGSICIRRNGI